MELNADFARRVAIHAAGLPWVASPMAGVERVLGPDEHLEALRGADGVVLALPLLPSTTGLIGPEELDAMEDHAWLVNVARGAHVRTDALVEALRQDLTPPANARLVPVGVLLEFGQGKFELRQRFTGLACRG